MLLHWGGIRFWWFRWGPCPFSTIHLGTGALTVQLQRCFAWGVACKPTNLFLPKFSTGAEWNAEFQAVKRCSGLEVLKVYLEALGERQKNVGSFVSGAWLCDHPKFGLFRPVVGQRLRNLLLHVFLSIFGSNSHQITGSIYATPKRSIFFIEVGVGPFFLFGYNYVQK